MIFVFIVCGQSIFLDTWVYYGYVDYGRLRDILNEVLVYLLVIRFYESVSVMTLFVNSVQK